MKHEKYEKLVTKNNAKTMTKTMTILCFRGAARSINYTCMGTGGHNHNLTATITTSMTLFSPK
jgi:hypothetical protein